uniref:Amino acid transporter transmembrane domain-containing protein n=1 Tax=Globisporangium ultimum (strain ATCC 200006 / CBS 805.95 / DAOM BR144) TaxID=431595 RepID=K3X6X1_GLOUD
MVKKPPFTLEDAKVAANLFCCVYGVGTLGMPGNFSRAGPMIAVFAMLFMAAANVYASVVISKVMLLAPSSVKTYSDLGDFCMGKVGRWLVVVSQMGYCLSIPIWYFVLGGTLLDSLFPGAFSQSTWIILMAISVTPVCLTPTLKEGAAAAFAGCVGTLVADFLALGMLLHGMSGHPSVPSPDISFKQVATTFGNLSLAYGAGIVIPALQRQHSDPTRMPRIVFVTITFISCLFLVLASTGYSVVGCQISGNMLFSIFPDSVTGLSKLGFSSNKGLAILAYLCMQLHITIAFAVIISPAFYLSERMLLGMHQPKPNDIESLNYQVSETPGARSELKSRISKGSVVSVADIEKVSLDPEEELLEYRGANVIKYILLRVAIIVVLVIIAIVLRNDFSDLQDFIGSSAMSLSCIILPIIFYVKVMWKSIPMYEKIPAITCALVCAILGCYVTYNSGKNLFNPDEVDPAILFPFCHPDEERQLYYNASSV